jgi:hypothetical protein
MENGIKKEMWMVRAGEDGRYFNEFKSKGFVAIGWSIFP